LHSSSNSYPLVADSAVSKQEHSEHRIVLYPSQSVILIGSTHARTVGSKGVWRGRGGMSACACECINPYPTP